MESLFELELEEIRAEVVRKRMKYVRLTVHPPAGNVRISAPARMSLRSIRAFGLSKLDWIRRQRTRMQRQGHPPAPRFLDGESHFVWGLAYPLAVLPAGRAATIELGGDRLLLRVEAGAGVARRRSLLEGWYRAQAAAAARPLIARWEPRLAVKVERLSVRHMKTRWGSCTPRTRAIRLNSELAKRPPECLEYIVVHELAHILEPSHNARFVALMDQFLPPWRRARELLKQPQRADGGANETHLAPPGPEDLRCG